MNTWALTKSSDLCCHHPPRSPSTEVQWTQDPGGTHKLTPAAHPGLGQDSGLGLLPLHKMPTVGADTWSWMRQMPRHRSVTRTAPRKQSSSPDRLHAGLLDFLNVTAWATTWLGLAREAPSQRAGVQFASLHPQNLS